MNSIEYDFSTNPPTCRIHHPVSTSRASITTTYGDSDQEYVVTEREYDDPYPGGMYYVWKISSRQGSYLCGILDKDKSDTFSVSTQKAIQLALQ